MIFCCKTFAPNVLVPEGYPYGITYCYRYITYQTQLERSHYQLDLNKLQTNQVNIGYVSCTSTTSVFRKHRQQHADNWCNTVLCNDAKGISLQRSCNLIHGFYRFSQQAKKEPGRWTVYHMKHCLSHNVWKIDCKRLSRNICNGNCAIWYCLQFLTTRYWNIPPVQLLLYCWSTSSI